MFNLHLQLEPNNYTAKNRKSISPASSEPVTIF